MVNVSSPATDAVRRGGVPAIGHQQNFWSGWFFFLFGGGFSVLAGQYPIGSASRMGAGFFPLCLGILLAAFGLLVILSSLSPRHMADPKPSWRAAYKPSWRAGRKPSWHAAPKPSWHAAPKPSWHAVPKPSWHAAPKPSWHAAPKPSWHAAPKPSWRAAYKPSWRAGHKPSWHAAPKPSWQGAKLVWILGAVTAFALLLEPAGLVISLSLLVLIASRASHQYTLRGTLANAAVLVTLNVTLFIWGLDQLIPVWPAFITH